MSARFTSEQVAAIERREGPMLLSAAAGSGKTTVLVERFVRMVVEDGIAPGRILAITFTDKAAGELRSRIRRELLRRGRRDLAQEVEGAWVGTFHGFCARVLRAHAVAAGLDPAFVVLDEASGRELREAAFEEALAGLLGDPADPPRHDALDLLAAYGADDLRSAVTEIFGQLRSAGQLRPSLPAVAAAADPAPLLSTLRAAADAATAFLLNEGGSRVEAARAAIGRLASFKGGNSKALSSDPCFAYLAALEAYEAARVEAAAVVTIGLLDELLGRYADAYAAAKTARSAVDFDDLELLVAALFDAQPGLAASWAARFDRIMVDEFQDTNAVQVALLARLDSGHTFHVGDELQSIYGFRHASVELFRDKRRELGAELLTANFRTRAEILEAVNAASAEIHEAFEPLVAGRAGEAAKEPLVELLVVHSENGLWDDADLGLLPGGPRWRHAEARLLAQRIAELVSDGVHAASDIVVLVRAATDIACYERAIEECGLSTLSAGGRGFWARQQVQDLTAYLAALTNPQDELALFGLLASPLGPGLSSDALALLSVAARREGIPVMQAVVSEGVGLPEADAARLAAWLPWFVEERVRAPRLTLAELLNRVIVWSGYDEVVLRQPGGRRRLANVRKLVRLAASYEREAGRGVRGFIDRATAELEAEAREADAPVELAGLDAVRLMTIHAAKGLEFPVVAVADLGRAPNLNTSYLLVDGDRVGVRVKSFSGTAESAEYAALKEERLAREHEESLRVFHVAMTRAQDRLILSGAIDTEKWPDGPKKPPIGWLVAPFRDQELVRETILTPDSAEISPTVLPSGPPTTTKEHPSTETPIAEPREVPTPPPVSALSYSALSSYSQCGYRFYLERVLRLPPQEPPAAPPGAPTPTLDPRVRGTIAHELLENLDLTAPQLPDDEQITAQAERNDTELTAEDVADLRVLLEGAISSETIKRLSEAEQVHAEEPFALAFTNPAHTHVPLFTGYLDVRAVEAGGTALVVDYKTDRLDGADPEVIVDRDYGVQRRLYALAALRAGATRAEVVHLFLEQPNHPATAIYEKQDADRLEDEIAARAQGVLNHDFKVAEHPHRELCASCPGRGGLCSWPEDVVLRSRAES